MEKEFEENLQHIQKDLEFDLERIEYLHSKWNELSAKEKNFLSTIKHSLDNSYREINFALTK